MRSEIPLPITVSRALEGYKRDIGRLEKHCEAVGLDPGATTKAIDNLDYFVPNNGHLREYTDQFSVWARRAKTKQPTQLPNYGTALSHTTFIGVVYEAYPDVLSDRQRRVVGASLEGQSTAEIAASEGVKLATVKSYLSNSIRPLEAQVATPLGYRIDEWVIPDWNQRQRAIRAGLQNVTMLDHRFVNPDLANEVSQRAEARFLAGKDGSERPRHKLTDLIPDLMEELRGKLTQQQYALVLLRTLGKTQAEIVQLLRVKPKEVKRHSAGILIVSDALIEDHGYTSVSDNHTLQVAAACKSIESAEFLARVYITPQWLEAYEPRRHKHSGSRPFRMPSPKDTSFMGSLFNLGRKHGFKTLREFEEATGVKDSVLMKWSRGVVTPAPQPLKRFLDAMQATDYEKTQIVTLWQARPFSKYEQKRVLPKE